MDMYEELNMLKVADNARFQALVSKDQELYENLSRIIKETNGNDKHVKALMDLHIPLRTQVNKNIIKGLKELDKEKLPRQVTVVLDLFN